MEGVMEGETSEGSDRDVTVGCRLWSVDMAKGPS